MSSNPSIAFSRIAEPKTEAVVFLAGEGGAVSKTVAGFDPANAVSRAVAAADFAGKAYASIELLGPDKMAARRVIIVGTNPDKDDSLDWMRVGGAIAGKLGKAKSVTVVMDAPGGVADATAAASVAAGIVMRAYSFDKYKTVRKNDNGKAPSQVKVTMACADPAKAKKAWASMSEVVAGVVLARDLVNEPPNVLGPVEFAEQATRLGEFGVEVEILTDKEMKKLKMGALLGVAQGSVRPARMAVMRWNGGKKGQAPLAFIGKGVVFDTGGISIKPAGGMEDMKGDMGGAAAVIGLMRALAGRKAKVNAIGILGLVENMPDGNAQRPGDIVTSMSGQTIEIINTDAEGRLVLCDALHFCRERYKPAFMINLATLTGAILVALGNTRAGLFSNNDDLAGNLAKAGDASGERVWRMPLGPEYDKMIDSKFADMKNTGGRHAGSITAAQFLQRFVGDTPWAHLDVAGTAMGSPSSEINQSWGSGYGVRLLDRLVADYYEGK